MGITITAGQIWESCDKRESPPRQLRVDGVSAVLVYLVNTKTGVRTRANPRRFVGTENAMASAKRTGYRLVKDV